MADTEQFNDFKEPISPSNYVDPTIEGVFNKELSEVEAFKAEFDDTLEMSDDPKKELTETIVGYIQGLGDVNQVNLYSYDNGNGVALDGWAFNGDEDLTSLDLFLTVYVDPGKTSKISATELDRHFNWLYRFYDQSLSGVVFGKISDTKSDLYRIADIIHSAERVDRVRLFLMTNAIAPSDYDKNNTEIGEGTICEYVIWDAKRVMRQNEIISGKSSIIVNFEADYNSPLPCIQMPDVSENVRCYLCVISGNVLAQIYHKHHQQILEQNVRTFLQFKGASNKGIRDTMIGHTATKVEMLKGVEDTAPEPDMFFAYNNGISTTASDIEVRPTDNGYEITQIKDWQIVNGGQTTASISAVLSMKNVDFSQLAKVFVPMKVSVIKNKDQQSLIVHKISKFANTQSAVKKSDFNINEPFLVDIEQHSRQEWVKNQAGKPVSKWFFERTRGQYLDKANHNPTKAAEKEFYAEYPRNQMFDKAMLSKFMMSWLLNPSSVCKGGENNYAVFYAQMKANRMRFDTENYHRTIAKAILFKAIDAFYGKEGLNLPGYKSNMVAYTLSALAFLTKKKLDLGKIWSEQCVISMPVYHEMTIDIYNVYAKLLQGQQHITYKVKEVIKTDDGRRKSKNITKNIPQEDIDAIKSTVLYKTMELVKAIEPEIWDHTVNVDAGTNINEWTKASRCWDALKNKLANSGDKYKISQDILSTDSSDDSTQVVLNEAQQKIVEVAAQITADEWFSLNQWAKNTEGLTPIQTSFIGNFAFMVKKNRPFTYKQAKYALDLYEKAQDSGWNGK